MTKPIITQEQLQALLSSLSLKDKIFFSLENLIAEFDHMLREAPSHELLLMKRNCVSLLKFFDSKDELDSEHFLEKFMDIYDVLLKKSDNMQLFKITSRLYNQINLLVNGLQDERRKESRIPITLEAEFITEHADHIIIITDISTSGMSFYTSEEFALTTEGVIKFYTDRDFSCSAVIRHLFHNKNLKNFGYTAGAELINSLNLNDIHNIVNYFYRSDFTDY